MSRFSQNQRDRERLAAIDKEREHQMRAWSDARNEGISEGLLMAIAVIINDPFEESGDHEDAIKARGDRHFGDAKWQTEARRGTS